MSDRTGFSSRIGFIAAAAGSAVGLGNIWKFPYETAKHGGGAFLVVYLLCIFLVGFPVMVGEIAIGRSTQLNPYGAYRKLGGSSWGWIGLMGILCSVMILSFYNVVAGWAFGYFLQIGFGNLLSAGDFAAFFGKYTADITDIFFYGLGFVIMTGAILARGVHQGIERASKILMPLLCLILLGLIAYALTLPNAFQGVQYYLNPDFSKIDLTVVNSAMGHAFFSLSLGVGGLITYGSYLSKSDNITSTAAIVTGADTAVAFFAGLLMIPLVFVEGVDPGDGGPGLVFTVLPGIFSSMGPITGRIVGASFFLLLCVAAITSTISLLEIPVSYLVDEKKWNRPRAVGVMSLVIFLLGLLSMLSYGAVDALGAIPVGTVTKPFLDLVADTFLNVGLPLGGMLMCIFIATRWKTYRMAEEISQGNAFYKDSWLQKVINFMISYICPLILAFLFLFNLLESFFGVSIFG